MENQVPCILIVDDDPNLIGSISDILSAKGFEAIAALTGASALASIKQHHIDVALIDLRLEDMSGLDVLKRIKENSPEIECIFLTGHASQSSAIEAIQMGAFGFFQKPFDVDQLLLFIQRAIEKHAAVEALRKSEERYHGFFEDTPIAIWQEDFSELKRHLDELKKQGVTDFREYFASHADALLEYSQMIKIVDVNSAALQLYGAENKEALIKSTDEILSKGEQEHILEVFVAVAEGKTSDSWEDLDETMSGEKIEINLSWSVAPGSEDDYSKVMVTTQDITERRKAERALRQSEARFHALIQNAADLILVIDPDGVIQYASPSSERILGYTDQEFVGKKFHEWVHPEDLPLAVEALNRRREIAGTSTNSIAVRCMHKNGTWRVIEVLGTNLLAEPSIKGIVMNIRDITERKLAESALSENEERYRLLFENAPVGIFSANSQGQIIEINPVAMQILGSPSVEATKAINLLTFPLLVETGFSAKFRQCFETGNPVFAEQSYTSKWGKLIYAQYRMTPIKDASGQITLVQVILEDITERKLNEEKVHKLAFMLDMAPNSITVHDFDGKALMANERAIEMHGFKREEFMALNLNHLDAPESEPLISSRMQLLRERGEAIFEVGHHRKDGSILPLEVSARVANWGDQQAILSIGTDITVRKQTEEQLRLQSSALNAAANAIVITDVNGAVQWANPAFTLLTGYTLEESLNKNPRELVRSGQQGKAYYQNMWNTILSGDVWHGEIVNRRKDGSHYSEELTITPLKDAEGQVIHFIAVKQDITERKQAEAALSVREKQYRTLVEQLPAIVYIDDINIEGRTMYVSPQIETILGFTPQEWQEKSPGLWNQQVHPDDLEWVHAEYMRCFQNGEPLDYEYRIRASDGRLLWFRDQAILLRDENGKPYLIQGVIYDITERKQSEKILRDRERSLRESQMIAGLGSYVFDIQRGMWTSSEVLDQIFGIDENYVRSVDGWQALIHPDFRQAMSDYLAQEILGNHARFDREYKIVREIDGVEVWVHGLGELELDAQNQPVELKGTIQDITERKQADAALEESERFARATVDALTAHIAILDGDGVILAVNRAWRNFSEENSPTIINLRTYEGINYLSICDSSTGPGSEEAAAMAEGIRAVISGGQKEFSLEYPCHSPFGKHWFNARVTRFPGYGALKIVVAHEDVTELKQAEELLRQQSQQLQLLFETSQRLNRTLDLNEIYQAVCDFMSTVAANDGLFISSFDHETQLITCNAYWMEGKWLDVSPFPAIPLEEEGKGTQSRVIRSGQPLLINDYQEYLKTASKVYYVDSETNEFVDHVLPEDEDTTRSALIVPLKSGDKINGVIQVVSYHQNAYTENQLKLLESLALHIVSAEKNALLYSQVQVELNERRQAEVALRDREEQYRTLVEQVPAIVYIDDATTEPGQTIYISPQIENILGFTPEEWRQGDLVSWVARLHPDDAQHTLDEFLRCFKGGEPIDSEYRMIAADGRCLWIRDQAVRLNDEDGKPRFIHGIMSDITQRKWADEAIHQRVMELELLYESGLAFIQLLHPKEIAQKIINLLEQKMNWHHTAIRLFDPETGTIQLLAFNQPNLTSAEEIAAVEERLKTSIARPGQGLSGWVIQHGEAVRSDDLAGDERYIESVPGMKSGLYVPIKLSDHVIGVISIESDKPDAFSVADERLVNTLVNQAASALENARLFDETRQRIMELTALHSTGQTLLASRLDPQQIYAEVHKAVLQTMPCDAFVIVLDDEERGDYHAVYFLDKGIRYPERRLPRGKGLSGRVISSGETLFIHDVVETPQVDATHFGSMELSRSILAVPLHRGDVVIGMLSTQSYKPHVFGEPQRVMLETIAAQLSSALDNTNLYQQTRARINELETLHTISVSLRTVQTANEALSTILDNILDTLDTDSGSILLYDPPSNELRDIVVRGWFTKLADVPITVGEGVAGTVFATGELYSSFEFARDALPHSSTRNSIPAGWGGVCMPIRAPMEIIGVLFASVKQPRYINSQQIRLLESLVDMAGSAVHRMRLHSETARRAEEFESLYDMSKVLSAEYDLNSLLGVIVKGVKVMMNTSTSGMYLYHADSQELELTMDTEPSIPLGIRLKIGEGVAGKVAETRQPMRIDNYSTWEGRSEKFDKFPIHSVIEVPMLYAGELIGVLTADETGDSGRKFTDADERLLSLFASQAAGAINSARHRAYIIRYAEELEQRVAERTAEIETTRQRLDLAAGAAGIGVWEVNLKELKVFWDPRMHDIHGTDPATFDNLLTTWWQMIYPDDIADSQKRFQDALLETGVFSDQHRIIRADGALRHISASGIVLYDEENSPARLIGVNMDVTEQKNVEGTLQRANLEMERAMRTKDEFLANMSHELRTPLNSILGISESLEEQIVGNLNEKQLRYIGIVKESGRHLLELINDILDISKIEAGRMELDLHNVSVEKLCQSSLRMIKELAQKKNLKVAFEVIGPVDVVLGDERRLKQSLVNLLSNAVKFTPADSHIGLEVCGHPQENEVTFTVWDKGVGIAQEDIQYLFKPFVQLDSGLTREYQGTGLGLALVAQMMRLHGGRVELESEVGEGSRFTITLPWLPEQQNTKTKSTSELSRPSRPEEKHTGKVLLVEDTEVISSLMNEYLHYKGYQVFIARNGMEGFLLAKEETPDLILMDIMMPVMDGLEATKLIREVDALKHTPIVALTALAMPGDRERCIAAGMTDYLSKPIRIQELADMIQKHLISKGQKPNDQ